MATSHVRTRASLRRTPLMCHHSAGAVCVIAILLFLRETRSAVLLTRLAKKMRKETGNHQYRARAEDERGRLRTLIYISCTRPLCTGRP